MPSRLDRSRRTLRQLLASWVGSNEAEIQPVRGRLKLEPLESRQLLAGDVEFLSTDSQDSSETFDDAAEESVQVGVLAVSGPDLVQFATDLSAAGVTIFGSPFDQATTDQLALFEDGVNQLPFVDVTVPDGQLNAVGIAEGIDPTSVLTIDFPNGIRLTGIQTLETISQTAGVPIPISDQPSFQTIGDQFVGIGSPLHVPVDAFDPGGGPLTTTVTVADPSLLDVSVLENNRSLSLVVERFGELTFELFEQRAPRATQRIVELTESGFFDGVVFHRIVNNFVIQGGDPTGTGSGGSDLGDFDDDFDPELQHNSDGLLSFANAGDDTNDSQFFITEGPQRFLDFNHSVFGQLIEGFDVRNAITDTAVQPSIFSGEVSSPVTPVVIESATIFEDTENSTVLLRPTGNGTGTTDVTVTVTDEGGNTFSQTFSVTVGADTVNNRPFLEDIPEIASSPINQPAQAQLVAIDVDGDPVQFFAASAPAGATVDVDPNTGLVTVTPATGFAGTIDVTVGVIGDANPSDPDTQVLSFTFDGEAVAAPTGLDLLSTTDSGASNSDNITNAGTLTFVVEGTTSGQLIELVDTSDGVVLGVAVASGPTTTVSTNNFAALPDGVFNVAARASVDGVESGFSPILAVTFDTTAPTSVLQNAPTVATVDDPFDFQLDAPESGLGFALVSGPVGASVDATTGQVTFTPNASQVGNADFVFEVTDLAGNSNTETLSVTIEEGGPDLAEIRLEATDLQGNPISSLSVGDQFLLNVSAADLRLFFQPGVFAAFADILFDSSLVQPVASVPIDFNNFTLNSSGTILDGLIDELGGAQNTAAPTNVAESLVATVTFEAVGVGQATIESEAAENPEALLLFSTNEPIPASAVEFESITLAIGQDFLVGSDSFTVAEDSGSTQLDVLANDSILVGAGTLAVSSVNQPAQGGSVELVNGVVSFTPDPNFFGTAEFTYVVTDGSGAEAFGSVTVTVTAVNDPPTAGDDTFEVDEDSSANILAVLANDSSAPDGFEPLTIASVSPTTNGGTVTIGADNVSLLFTPAPGFVGVDTFTYDVTDGELSSTATVTVTVLSVDDPPTAVDDSFTVAEDSPATSFDVLANDLPDADGQTFSITNVGIPSQGGTVTISADSTAILYTPAVNFAGSEEVTYTITDTGGGTATGTVTFTVTAVNDPPPSDNLEVSVNRASGEALVFEISDLVNVDAGETLTISDFDATTVQGGTVRLDSITGQLFYTASSDDFAGTDSFNFTLDDGSGLTSTSTITIEVLDFVARDILLALIDTSASLDATRFVIRGTTITGETIEATGINDAEGIRFEDQIPGDFEIEIPAVPFLINGEEPQVISLSSAPDDGDLEIPSPLGRLRPEFISIRDFLQSTPRDSVLVAVSPGETSLLAQASGGNVPVSSPVAELDANGDSLTLRAVTVDEVTQAETPVEATLSASSDPRVESRGEVDGIRLFRIDVDQSVLAFTPSSTVAAASVVAGADAASSTASVAAALSAPIEPTAADVPSVSLTNPLVASGSLQSPQSNPVVAAAVTGADVFVPSTQQPVATELVLPTTVGDVFTDQVPASAPSDDDGEDENDLIEPIVTATSIGLATDSQQSIDLAMESVAEELTRRSVSEDELSEQNLIDQDGVDAVLGGLDS